MIRIDIDALSAESFRKAARRVRRLQRAYVNCNREFVRKLTQAGIKVISENLDANGDSDPPEMPTVPHVLMSHRETYMMATLRLRGEDVMFVEFGAGITYNTEVGSSLNPKGVELGYTIGSYGKGQGAQEYWFYDDEEGTHISYGTEAAMPMWKADQEIRQKFASIARSVFSITGV